MENTTQHSTMGFVEMKVDTLLQELFLIEKR